MSSPATKFSVLPLHAALNHPYGYRKLGEKKPRMKPKNAAQDADVMSQEVLKSEFPKKKHNYPKNRKSVRRLPVHNETFSQAFADALKGVPRPELERRYKGKLNQTHARFIKDYLAMNADDFHDYALRMLEGCVSKILLHFLDNIDNISPDKTAWSMDYAIKNWQLLRNRPTSITESRGIQIDGKDMSFSDMEQLLAGQGYSPSSDLGPDQAKQITVVESAKPEKNGRPVKYPMPKLPAHVEDATE